MSVAKLWKNNIFQQNQDSTKDLYLFITVYRRYLAQKDKLERKGMKVSTEKTSFQIQTEEELQHRFMEWKGTLERKIIKEHEKTKVSNRAGHEKTNILTEDDRNMITMEERNGHSGMNDNVNGRRHRQNLVIGKIRNEDDKMKFSCWKGEKAKIYE